MSHSRGVGFAARDLEVPLSGARLEVASEVLLLLFEELDGHILLRHAWLPLELASVTHHFQLVLSFNFVHFLHDAGLVSLAEVLAHLHLIDLVGFVDDAVQCVLDFDVFPLSVTFILIDFHAWPAKHSRLDVPMLVLVLKR